MSDNVNNRRIAKNSLMLYLRMFFSMAVALYTSRVVLRVLGVDDYGIYNVVGGVIVLFSFMNVAMSGATQRFLTFDLGKGDAAHLKRVFGTALQIHAVMALVVLLLGETVGLWLVMNKLVIPPDRMDAALWVYQMSVAACMVSVVGIPFNACIIAHERMKVFAAVSMMDVTLRLGVVGVLAVAPCDKLVLYAVLVLCVQVLVQVVYGVYCRLQFGEARISFRTDRGLWREMSGFAGWSLCGNVAYVLYTEGVNIVLNLFFGPALNAARGIAVQVQGAVSGFVANVQMAVNPQITKSFAQGNLARMHSLMFGSSKFCFFLLLIIALPLGIEADAVLGVWLVRVPAHTVWFLRLVLGVMLVETLANPYMVTNQATGKIRLYQLVCGGILLCIVPLSYVVLKLGACAESVYVVYLVMAVLAQVARVLIMRRLIDMPFLTYCRKVLMPVAVVAAVAPVLPLLVYASMPTGVVQFLVVCTVSVISTSLAIWLLGLTREERMFIASLVQRKLSVPVHELKRMVLRLLNTVYTLVRYRGRFLLVNCYVEQWFGRLSKNNLGDELNVYLLEALTDKKVVNSNSVYLPFLTDYMVIGSVVENYCRRNTVIWGGGTIDGDHLPLCCKPKRVCAVRGKRTMDYLMSHGVDSPQVYGDPALLMPRVYNPDVEKKYRLGVIPHVADMDTPFMQSLCRSLPDDVTVIRFRDYGDWHDVIRQVKSCEFIASSSLHGIILSDAYGVANVWVRMSSNIIGGDYKFQDYFSAVGRRLEGAVSVDASTSWQSLLEYRQQYNPIAFDADALLRACPFESLSYGLVEENQNLGKWTRKRGCRQTDSPTVRF